MGINHGDCLFQSAGRSCIDRGATERRLLGSPHGAHGPRPLSGDAWVNYFRHGGDCVPDSANTLVCSVLRTLQRARTRSDPYALCGRSQRLSGHFCTRQLFNNAPYRRCSLHSCTGTSGCGRACSGIGTAFAVGCVPGRSPLAVGSVPFKTAMMGAPIDGSSVRIKPSAEGGAPQGVREQNYLRPPVDFLRVWHMKVEA
jgi:hypothetical protein